MKKTKVIHVITLLEMGGAQGNTLFTVENLDRNKFDVGLLTGPKGILDERAKKIPNLFLKFIPSLVRSVHPIKDFFCLLELIEILKREKPDIVHTHSSKAGILGRLAAKMAGIPIIIHSIHGFGFNPYQRSFVRGLFIFLEKWMAHFTNVLIAVSKDNIKEGLSLGIGRKEQYELIRSGVDIPKIKEQSKSTNINSLKKELQIPERSMVILSVGPFKFQKDPLSFVEIAQKVIQEVPDAIFVWSGDGELRPQVEKKISELKLEQHIKLLGWRKDIPSLIAMSDIFILTSLWEGLPRAGVEALLVGKPVVAFSVNGIPEIVKDGENGFLIRPGEREKFAKRIIELLKDTVQRQKMGETALKSIDETFDINGMVPSQEKLYDKTLARANSR